MRPLPKFLWFLLALFAFVNALEALRYRLPHVPFPAELDNFTQRRIAPSLHALGGAIALLAGSGGAIKAERAIMVYRGNETSSEA